MVVVEDLISTGGSVLEAVAAAKREGADVLGVVAIFSYQLPKADKNFADAGESLLPFYLKYDNILNKIIDNAFFY
ncbi:orotate phosphoribosyltransferase [Streptococcus pneumoniae]|nr:orotate phosphoribosyltransferase [Streptococcus pneumoniae]